MYFVVILCRKTLERKILKRGTYCPITLFCFKYCDNYLLRVEAILHASFRVNQLACIVRKVTCDVLFSLKNASNTINILYFNELTHRDKSFLSCCLELNCCTYIE